MPQVLFDHLVGAPQKHGRHVEADRLGGLQVDDKLELGRKLSRQVVRLRAAQDAVDIVRGATPKQVVYVGSIRHQAPRCTGGSRCVHLPTSKYPGGGFTSITRTGDTVPTRRKRVASVSPMASLTDGRNAVGSDGAAAQGEFRNFGAF